MERCADVTFARTLWIDTEKVGTAPYFQHNKDRTTSRSEILLCSKYVFQKKKPTKTPQKTNKQSKTKQNKTKQKTHTKSQQQQHYTQLEQL